jgi:hypothetical protein
MAAGSQGMALSADGDFSAGPRNTGHERCALSFSRRRRSINNAGLQHGERIIAKGLKMRPPNSGACGLLDPTPNATMSLFGLSSVLCWVFLGLSAHNYHPTSYGGTMFFIRGRCWASRLA